MYIFKCYQCINKIHHKAFILILIVMKKINITRELTLVIFIINAHKYYALITFFTSGLPATVGCCAC